LAQYDINLREYWRILKKRKAIVIITAILLGIFSTVFAVFQAPAPLYTSVCSIKFEKETTLEGLYARTFSWSSGDDIETQISIMKSFSVLLEVAKRAGLIPHEATADDPAVINAVDRLKSKVTVERENYTNILNIMVTDRDPAFAQKLANELASSYKDLHAEQQGKRTTDAIKYIEEQLKTVREKLREAEEAFNRFGQENQLISVDMQSENLLVRDEEIRDEIRELNEDESDFRALSVRIEAFLQDTSFSSDASFYSSKASPQYQASNNNLVELLLERDSLLENYTYQHPEVMGISQKITETARKMLMLLRQQIADTQKRRSDLGEELREVNRKTTLLMEKKLEFDRLKREVESFRDMTALLEQKYQEALIAKAEKPEEIVIVRPALKSTTPINPPKTAATGVMGTMIGIVLGLIFAFIVETFDTSLGAIEDVESTLGAKVLGVIPHAEAKDILMRIKGKIEKGDEPSHLKRVISLVSHFAPKTMIAESFRGLRTNIQFRDSSEKTKTIAVTSSSPQEGKTLVSVNLAVSLAQAGLKTLLVGADLRKPMLGTVFGVEEAPGLTDIIFGNYPWKDTVKTITDIIMGRMTMDDIMVTPGMDNLNIITSGVIPPNPSELIESGRLTAFIEEAKKEYDIIVFDSSPVLSTAEAPILGKKTDGVLIVYRLGFVSRGLLKRTSTQLQQVNCNIIGVVLNGMKPDISPDFADYKKYKYYSSYYGEEEGKERHEVSKGLFSLFRRKGKKGESSVGTSISSGMKEKGKDKNKRKKGLFLRWFLIILALLLLSTGIFIQRGRVGLPEQDKEALNDVVKGDAQVESSVPEVPPAESLEVPPPPQLSPPAEDKSVEEEPVYSPGAFPFSVYFGSFQTKEKAEEAIAQYSRKGLSPFWVRVELGDKGTWYRVYSGYFNDVEQAQRYINQNDLTEAGVKNTAYADLIGGYNNGDDLRHMRQKIEALGYSTYTLKDQDNTYFLFVGAFLTEEGAGEQLEELRSDGILSRIVRR